MIVILFLVILFGYILPSVYFAISYHYSKKKIKRMYNQIKNLTMVNENEG